jgi:hypothetical protein
MGMTRTQTALGPPVRHAVLLTTWTCDSSPTDGYVEASSGAKSESTVTGDSSSP